MLTTHHPYAPVYIQAYEIMWVSDFLLSTFIFFKAHQII